VPSRGRVAMALGPLGEVSRLVPGQDFSSWPTNRSREAILREFGEDVHLLRELLGHPLPRKPWLGRGRFPSADGSAPQFSASRLEQSQAASIPGLTGLSTRQAEWLTPQPPLSAERGPRPDLIEGAPATRSPSHRPAPHWAESLPPLLVEPGPPLLIEQGLPADQHAPGRAPAAEVLVGASGAASMVPVPPFAGEGDAPLSRQPFIYYCGLSVLLSCCCCITMPIDPDTITFDVFIDVVIIVNCVLLLLDYHRDHTFYYYAEQLFISIFFVEMLTRMRWQRLDWFMDPWNYFDAILVFLGVLESWGVPFLINVLSDNGGLLDFIGEHGGLITTLRLLRLLRLCRLLRPHSSLLADDEEPDELNEVWVSLPNADEASNAGKRRKRGGNKSGGKTPGAV